VTSTYALPMTPQTSLTKAPLSFSREKNPGLQKTCQQGYMSTSGTKTTYMPKNFLDFINDDAFII